MWTKFRKEAKKFRTNGTSMPEHTPSTPSTVHKSASCIHRLHDLCYESTDARRDGQIKGKDKDKGK